jgi:hypothetical protein
MADSPPAWLRRELPQPIASAWHLASNSEPVSALAASGALEVALRFVCAVKLASLDARDPLPEILDAGTFKRPTLGSWLNLAKALRDAVRDPFVRDLRTWPDASTEATLRRVLALRNELAHAGQMTPVQKDERETEVVRLAGLVLESLEPLRKVDLVVASDTRPFDRTRNRGLLQRFRGWDDHPPAVASLWKGDLQKGRVYLASPDRPGLLLDLDPYLLRRPIAAARVESLALWKAFGARGDLLVSDDLARETEWVPLIRTARRIPFAPEPVPAGAEDATRADRPSDLPRTLLAAIRRPRQRRWRIFAACAGLAALALTIVAFFPTTPSVQCGPDALRGAWRFDTHILHGRFVGQGVRGHYDLGVGRVTPLDMTLDKTGYTQDGAVHGPRLRATDPLALSPSTCSATVRANLSNPSGASTEMGFRYARYGDRLIGLWRHEGREWEMNGRHSGALVGARPEQEDAHRDACFLACVTRCHKGADPLADPTEACLLGCAPRLEDCDG